MAEEMERRVAARLEARSLSLLLSRPACFCSATESFMLTIICFPLYDDIHAPLPH